MDTKEEIAAEINKLLNTKLGSLSRMTAEDLRILKDILLKSPERSQFLGPLFHKPIKEILNEKIKGLDTQLGDLTLLDVMGMESNGLLGLGILPQLRKMVTGDKKQT